MTPAAKRILLIDDDVNIRMLFKRVITKAGFTVAGEAPNGEEALKLHASLNPDLTLLDISMPQMDGLEVLQRMREIAPSARVAMLTATFDQDIIAQAMKAGAVAHIPKTASLDDIQKTLKELLAP
jgi:two-component system chemotaxis response regulator CheY